MPGFLDRYKTDPVAESDGKWFDLGDGVRVKVVRINNPKARKLRSTLERPYRGRDVPEDKLEEILNTVMAREVVRDWEGVTDDNGRAVPYTPEEAVRVFRKFPDFRDDVGAVALDREQFRAGSLEEDAGNS